MASELQPFLVREENNLNEQKLFTRMVEDRQLEVEQLERDRKDSITTLQRASSMFELVNPISSWYVHEPVDYTNVVPGYSPMRKDPDTGKSHLDELGLAQHAKLFAHSYSKETTEQLAQNLRRQLMNQEFAFQGDAWDIIGGIAVGITDPINLALVFATAGTGAGMTLAQQSGRMVAAGVAATSISEMTLHATQETRTIDESMLNIAATAMLDGILTYGIGSMRAISREGQIRLHKEASLAMKDAAGDSLPTHQSAGAMAYKPQGTATGAELKPAKGVAATIDKYVINPAGTYLLRKPSEGLEWAVGQVPGVRKVAPAMEAFNKYIMPEKFGMTHTIWALSRQTPQGRLLQNQHDFVRAAGQELFEIPQDVVGSYTPTSVYTFTKLDQAVTRDVSSQIEDMFQGLKKNEGWTRDQWNAEVADSMRNGNTGRNPAAVQAGKLASKRIDELWDRAYNNNIEGTRTLKIDPETGSPVRDANGKVEYEKVTQSTANGYLPRLYNVMSVRNNEEGFKENLRAGFADMIETGIAEFQPRITRNQNIIQKSQKQVDKLQGAKGEVGEIKKLEKVVSNLEREITRIESGYTGFLRKAPPAHKPDLRAQRRVEVAPVQKGLDNARLQVKEAKKGLTEHKNAIKVSEARIGRFKKNMPVRLSESELDSVVNGYYETVSGLRPGDLMESRSRPGGDFMRKSRVQIKDDYLADFLINDIDDLMSRYSNIMSSKNRLSELSSKYGYDDGEFTLKSMMEDISASYDNVIGLAKTPKIANELRAERKKVLSDIGYGRDKMLGLYMPSAGTAAFGENQAIASAFRTMRGFNTMRMMGMVTVASAPDISRVVAYQGVEPMLKGMSRQLAKMGKQIDKNDLDSIRRLANSMERTQNSRVQRMIDMDDLEPINKFEEQVRKTTDQFMRITGITHWNDFWKGTVAEIMNDSIARGVKSGNPKAFTDLKRLGFSDEMIDRVKVQIGKHSDEIDGFHSLNVDQWDGNAFDLVEAIQAGSIKEADKIIVTPGIGDKPIYVDNELGKTIMQFKSFLMGATNRYTMPMLQSDMKKGWTEISGGIAIGAAVYTLREKMKGNEPDLTPGNLFREGFDRAGVAAFGGELFNMTNSIFGLTEGTSRYQQRSIMAGLAGPTWGGFEDIVNAVNSNTTPDGRARSIRRLMPYQNMFGLSQALYDPVEREAAKAMGGTGKYVRGGADRQFKGIQSEGMPRF